MCGRYASTRGAADLASLFDALDEVTTPGGGTDDEVFSPSFNVAPTDRAPIIRRTERLDQPVVSLARWGLVPSWAAGAAGRPLMINARAETVATATAFRASFARRRCLVPADGWFEWTPTGSGKQPYFMTRSDGGPLVFGGIWTASNASGARLLTFSIVTCPSVRELMHVHDRMPLVLAPAAWHTWLTSPQPLELLAPPPSDYLDGIVNRPVSRAVGDVRNDGPELVKQIMNSSTMDDAEPTLF